MLWQQKQVNVANIITSCHPKQVDFVQKDIFRRKKQTDVVKK